MRSFQSKFANEKSKRESSVKQSSSIGGCCCGADIVDEKSEKETRKK